MRRLLSGVAAVLAPLVVLAPAPAAAAAPDLPPAPTVDVVIGYAADDFRVLEVPADRAAAVIAAARRQDEVSWAEVDVPMRAAASTPNDPYFPMQWGVVRTGAPEAWETTSGSADVLVAVVDTGVDEFHPELAGRVDAQIDTVGDGDTGDPNGHGTGVAGVIAAATGNGAGIAGYCGRCRVLPVRALDAQGAGASSTVAKGIVAAADRGADVINLSLAGVGSSATLEAAVSYARKRGAVVIAAAGNSGSSAPHWPAADPGVVGVAATTASDDRYPWSNYGTWADVAAPGCATTLAPAASYVEACGTSFAAPAVSGAVALAIAVTPGVSAQTIEAALLTTSVPIASGIVAAGRVDAASLVRAVATLPSIPTAQAPAAGGEDAPAVTDDVVDAPEVVDDAAPVADRVAGTNRIATAVALSERVRSSATDVVIARADAYADALAAAPLAGALDAPVLLTPSSSLAAAVSAEITRLGATTAWIVGGTGAIAPTVADALRAAGVTEVRRLAGADRADTARRIAMEVGGTSAIIAAADGWADAVAVSALAARTRTPILLASRTGLPAATLDALDALGVARVTIVGGAAAVPEAAASAARAAGAAVTRLAGANRYATSAAVADATAAEGADARQVWAATGRDWPDALAAGPAAAAAGSVLVLVDGVDGTSPETLAWISSHATSVTVVGGDASISTRVFSLLGG